MLVFLVSLAYLCLFRRYTTIEPDEGIVLDGAQRILHGQIIYRDFFSFLTPGSYYLTALMFKIFGSSFLVARTGLAVMGAIMTVITYLLSRRVCRREISLFVSGLVTLTALPYRFLTLHNWDSTFWTCLAVYCAVRLIESPLWGWSLALGSSVSLTFLFEQSKGTGLLLGLVIGFWLIASSGRDSCVLVRTMLGPLAAGVAWPIMMAVTYFAGKHAFVAMLSDWTWPLEHYSRANRVPYGFQNWSDSARHALFGTGSIGMRAFNGFVVSAGFVVPVLPLVALGLLLYWNLQLRRGLCPARAKYYTLVTAAISGLLVSVLIVRADIIHLMYLLPLLALVLAWIIEGNDIPGHLFKAVHPFLTAYLGVAFLAFSLPLLMRAVTAPHKLTTRRGALTTTARDTVIDYVQARVQPGEPMLVYPYLPLYNYLTETSSPTRYEYFQPGMNTTQQAKEMVADLASRRVPWVLFEPSFSEKIPNSWPGTPMNASLTDPVADYVATHYRPCAVLNSPSNWHFLFMIPKEAECPR